MQQSLTQEIIEKEFGQCKFSAESIKSEPSYFYTIIVNNYHIYIQDFEKTNEDDENIIIVNIFEKGEKVWLGIEFENMNDAISKIKEEIKL